MPVQAWHFISQGHSHPGLLLLFLAQVCCQENQPGATADAALTDAAVDTPPADLGSPMRQDFGPLPDQDPALVRPIPKFVALEPGTVKMGSPQADTRCHENAEAYYLEVTLTHGFEIMNLEVAQAEFKEVMGFNPSHFSSTDSTQQEYCGEADCQDHPIEHVSWHRAVLYCNQLSLSQGLKPCYTCNVRYWDECGPPFVCDPVVDCREAAGYLASGIYDCPGYRLPTQAEWEYAYRAGSETPFYPAGDSDGNWATTAEDGPCGDYCVVDDPHVDLIGWYCANSDAHTHRVGTKLPNTWGLYDMAGNVGEWCHDRWEEDRPQGPLVNYAGPAEGDSRIVKGGHWHATADFLRGGKWGGSGAQNGTRMHGFRCARSLLELQ